MMSRVDRKREEGIPPEKQRLTIDGKEMKDGFNLNDYDIRERTEHPAEHTKVNCLTRSF